MKYIKLFEEKGQFSWNLLTDVKIGNVYKHKHSVDGEHRESLAKLINFVKDAGKVTPTSNPEGAKFGIFEGVYMTPEHCKGEPIRFISMLGNLDEDSIPTEEEIQEYELINQSNNYNL